MPRPNVTISINDQSFVALNAETQAPHTSGLYTTGGLVRAVGSAYERQQGYIEVATLADWFGKLRTNTGVGSVGTSGDPTGLPFYHLNGGTGTGGNQFAGGTFERWPLGPTGDWAGEWWAAHNYLLYGGALVVGATGTQTHTTSNALDDKLIYLDSVFGATNDTNQEVVNVVNNRDDCIGIISVDSGTNVTSDMSIDAYDADDPYKIVRVYGEKIHVNIERLSSTFLDNDKLVTTTLAPDVAGCLARTDKLNAPWFSPGGTTRGRILDVVRLSTELTDTEQDNLYNDTNRTNPVVSFGGEGTFLFGDKTAGTDTSTLSRINVSRLFIYLSKTLGRIARDVLFEQNDSFTRASFTNQVTQVLDGVKSRRGVTDYKVVCDTTNNTPELIDANTFVADVFVKPTKSINYIRLRFTNKNESADLS